MDEQRQQRKQEAEAPPASIWEMLAKLTPLRPRPDPDGEEVIQTVGNPRTEPTQAKPMQAEPTRENPVAGESPSSTAKDRQRALTTHLMEQVCETENLNRAYARVKANKGSPGVDGMSVSQLIFPTKNRRISVLFSSVLPRMLQG